MSEEDNNGFDFDLSVHEETTAVSNGNPPEHVKEFMNEFEQNKPIDFEIHITDKNITSGAISISWCLSKNALESLKDASDPCVVIITSKGPRENTDCNENIDYISKKELRKVVRVKDLMAYLSFSSPGENRIHAFIAEDYRMAKKTWLDKVSNTWTASVFSYEGINFYNDKKFQADPLYVDVPENLFGKQPAQWEQDWVYWLNPRDKALDQCDFRSKRLVAYTLQPILLIINMIVRFVLLLWCVLWLNRGTWQVFKSLIHPLSNELSDITTIIYDNDSLLIYKKILETHHAVYDKENNIVQKYDTEKQYRYILFSPAGLLFMFGLINFAKFMMNNIHNWQFVLAVFSIACILLSIVFGSMRFVKYITETSNPITEEDVDSLICSENKVKSIADVHKKSIRLRYDDLKNKVCKPFSM